METPPRPLPVVTDDLALNFANTVDDPAGPGRHDHASTYADLLAWAVGAGAVTPPQADRLRSAAAGSPVDAAAAIARAHRLREVVGEVFTQVASGGSVAGWGDLRAFAVDALAHAELRGAGPYVLTWGAVADHGVALEAPLWPIAHAALALLTGPDVGRVKRCAGCPWLFVDRSKNASRRWCAMDDCGKHEKIRRYVSRRAARRQVT